VGAFSGRIAGASGYREGRWIDDILMKQLNPATMRLNREDT
jgi:hypothetical protein